MSLRRSVFELKSATVLRESHHAFAELVRNESLTGEELASLQRRRAIEHARYAMQSTPFYREHYRSAGLSLDDLRSPDVFDSLPVVEKHHVREYFEDFKTPDAERFGIRSMTGGSTGQPLHLLRDGRVSAQPLEWRLLRWWGVHPSDHIGLVWRHVKTGRQRLVHQAQWWPSRRIQLDAYRVNEVSVRKFVRQWQRLRPTLLTGYAGGILELARTVQRLELDFTSPRAVATTASPLTAQNRAEIEATLGAPVYDHYRSAEIPWMGGECRHRTGLHVFSDLRVVEVVGPEGKPVTDGPGRVVASDLTNRVFPLVRYRLGDRTTALAGTCPCGVPLPRIDHLIGREGDGLRLPDGTWVAAEAVITMFSAAPTAVAQFQVHQQADHAVQVWVVPGPAPLADKIIEDAVEVLRRRLDRAVPVRWDRVADIPHDGGKIRYVRSDVH